MLAWLEAAAALAMGNPMLVVALLFILAKMYQSRQPWPEVGGVVSHVHSMAEWSTLLAKGGLVMVDCYATWCPPCKVAAPIYARMSEEYADVVFAKVNVDEARDVAQHLAVSAMPTFKLFRGTVELGSQRGWSEEHVRAMLTEAGAAKAVHAAKAE